MKQQWTEDQKCWGKEGGNGLGNVMGPFQTCIPCINIMAQCV